MGPPDFIGRKDELAILNTFIKKKTASLLVVRGRRRIGKSRLIQEFARPYPYYAFSGIPPTSTTTAQSQRDEFAYQLSKCIGKGNIRADNWNTLFSLLAKYTETGRVIILFDEISWMGSKDPDFLGKLKNSWDLEFKNNNELILILCGSASSWIEKNILSSTGFVGRISFTLTLEELSFSDCQHFWRGYEKNISAYEKLKVLSVTGGIPKYLEEIDPRESAEENIRRLCFTKGGLLVNEFEHLFSSLFLRHSEYYQKILGILTDGPKEYRKICEQLKMVPTGRISEYLEELDLAGFIKRDYTWYLSTGKDSKLSRYRLRDNYLRFYLKYLAQYKTKIERNSFAFKSLNSLPEWPIILGLQFENAVLNNKKLIYEALSIKPEDIVSENPFFQHKTATQSGCQVDYLIQTRFHTLYICEIKFSKNPIGSEIIEEVQEKIVRIKRPKGFSCRPVLIHVNGVQEEVTTSEYFSDIIDMGCFLT